MLCDGLHCALLVACTDHLACRLALEDVVMMNEQDLETAELLAIELRDLVDNPEEMIKMEWLLDRVLSKPIY